MKELFKKLSRFLDPKYWKIILDPNFWNTRDSIVLIYNPSKVGSSSVYFTLKEDLKWLPINHLHYLNRDWLADFKEKNNNNWKNNILKADEVYKFLEEHKEKKIKIITLVRDPVALVMSSVFQGWKALYNTEDARDLKDEDIFSYLHKNQFDWLQTWYEKEFLTFTGVDVVQEPFDPNKGYGIYKKNHMEMLLIKLEDLDRVKDDAMKEFLGVKNLQWMTKNTSSSKGEISEIYSRIKKTFILDDEKLDRVYNNDFMKKFYSQEELNAFREKWQKNRG